ncbi:MAG TPA: hypothetical protein VGZ47_07210 [Gemmataceae bacterium]|jgi:hypothetical protein|nr:hypothetical protein [Gemmataceae bacterium]
MEMTFRQVDVTKRGDVFCARLNKRNMTEADLHQFGEEISELIAEHGCRKLALALGKERLDCLQSMFIGKLNMIRRLLADQQGHMRLCEIAPINFDVLKVCKITELIETLPDLDSAVKSLEVAD